MKVIAKYQESFGRMGGLSGIFVCDKEELEAAYGKEAYFGEVLGKHSEIYTTVDPESISVLSDDQQFIEQFCRIVGDGTVSGFNPLDYLREDKDEDEDDE